MALENNEVGIYYTYYVSRVMPKLLSIINNDHHNFIVKQTAGLILPSKRAEFKCHSIVFHRV